MNDYATSIIRTASGYAVAGVLALPIAPTIETAAGITATEARTALTAAAVFVIGSVYYAAARRIEQRWPIAGRFLGVASPPAYTTPANVGHDAESIAAKTGAELVDAEQ